MTYSDVAIISMLYLQDLVIINIIIMNTHQWRRRKEYIIA